MLQQLKFDFMVLFKRKKIQNMWIFITTLASLLAFILYYHKTTFEYANYNELFFLFNYYENGLTTIFIFLLPLLVGLMHGDANFYEGNFKRVIVTKTKLKTYYISKLIVVFLSGFAMIMYFILLVRLYSVLFISQNSTLFGELGVMRYDNPTSVQNLFPWLLMNRPHLYSFIYYMLISIYGGCMAMVNYIVSLFVKKYMTSIVSGFIFSISSLLITATVFRNGIHVWYLQNLVKPDPVFSTRPMGFTLERGMMFWAVFFCLIAAITVLIKSKNDL